MSRLRFARWVFLLAGIIGLVIVVPPFFQEDQFGRDYPPEITHPEFFYGFLTAVLAWQLMYITIGTDPVRFRCDAAGDSRKGELRRRSSGPIYGKKSISGVARLRRDGHHVRGSLCRRVHRDAEGLRRTSLASRVTCGALPIRAIGVIRGSTSLYGQVPFLECSLSRRNN